MLVKGGSRALELCRRLGARAGGEVQDVPALEVALGGDSPKADDGVRVIQPGRVQDLAKLVLRPDVEEPFDALGVRIECREEAALGAPHLAEHPFEGALACLAPALVANCLIAVEVGAREKGVVVEHLLEVRDQPLRVDGVASEAAADVIVDAAGEHAVEGPGHHLALAPRQEELDRRGGRELRRSSEAPVRPGRRW